MPLYCYECSECGHKFEETRKMADPNPPCPKLLTLSEEAQPAGGVLTHKKLCHGGTTKLLAKGSFHLKGSGWASDGYS